MKLKNQSIGSVITKIVSGAVGIIIVLFAMMTTFTFGMEVIGAFMLVNELGVENSKLLSGIFALLLFDASWIVAFFQFIHTAESLIQKALTMFQFVVCAVFSLTASIVSVILLSPLGSNFTPDSFTIASYIGVGALILAFIVSVFCSTVGKLSSPDVAQKLRESINIAKQVDFAVQAETALDAQTFTTAKNILTERIPELAQIRANQIIAQLASGVQQKQHKQGDLIIDQTEQPKRVGFGADNVPTNIHDGDTGNGQRSE